MEGIVILLKADDIAISSSLLATVYWSRDEDGIGWSKFFLEFALECPYVYVYLSFIKEQAFIL